MTENATELLLATYNIRLGIQRGLPAIAAALKPWGPLDAVAFQEVGDRWRMGPAGDSTAELARLLELPHCLHVPALVEVDPESGATYRYGHALVSRWPIQDSQVIDLPRVEDEPRALLRALLATPAGPVELLTTHLSYLDSDRPFQGEALLRWLSEHPASTPRFILGDLNATVDEPFLHALRERFVDADSEEARLTFPSDEPSRRIDYILGAGAELRETAVIGDREASDHFPLVSRWRLQDS